VGTRDDGACNKDASTFPMQQGVAIADLMNARVLQRQHVTHGDWPVQACNRLGGAHNLSSH
jgi:hypothetical protein